MKLVQAHDMSAKMVHATFHKDLQLSRSRPGERSNCLQGEEEGALKNVSGNHSNDRLGFLTILDIVSTVGESAGGNERAGWPQPQLGGLPEGAGGVTKNGAAANFAVALQR
jgi:hypothetical protein